MNKIIFVTLVFFISVSSLARSETSMQVQVDASREMSRLLRTIDADHDNKITILDHASSFTLKDKSGQPFEVNGTQALANLLQELKLAVDRKSSTLTSDRIFESPATRVSRSIKEIYWDGLTRRIDADHLAQSLNDSKTPAQKIRNLYVPEADQEAFDYFTRAAQPNLNVKIWKLPKIRDEKMNQQIQFNPGLLTLGLEKDAAGNTRGVPFVVPGGRFNEMYGWDSYFEALGLLIDDRVDLARAMVDNFVYEIDNYGKILNANRSYYLNRSQPPFLTSMIRAVAPHLGADRKPWLEKSLHAAIQEYLEVWQSPERQTETGLTRYFGSGHGIPPEVEPGHFNFILKPEAKARKISVARLIRQYNAGEIKSEKLDDFFAQDRAVRESGHDTTYRWRVGKEDHAADFVTVDLNSLLYRTELDIALLIKSEFNDSLTYAGKAETSAPWFERAAARKQKMMTLLWNPKRQLFFDYDFKRKCQSEYLSATAFYPFWAARDFLEPKLARESLRRLTAELEAPGGLAATAKSSLNKFGDLKNLRQWDYPNGWAPHQIIAWEALANVGETKTAERLIYKWLYTITRNAADFNGTVPEKFDVVKRSHAVFAEYGNVGTQFSYITKEGFGWMNASYQIGLQMLSPEHRASLEKITPPEWIRFQESP